MTTRRLGARQDRWAEFLSRFYFLIKYCTGKTNICADALTRRNQDAGVPRDNSNQVILHQQRLEAQILEELAQATPQTDSLVKGGEMSQIELEQMDAQLHIIDSICQANCEWNQKQQVGSEEQESAWTSEGGLLLYHN